ncbi:7SK snRNA methylphosphate capping enzyme-like [Panonychus citri]|uniref:7SK snRNA methylphosphate capping enzyme-like n=1 Tax=Panonychus citri TaxID=50023 RepID=UPI00230702CD|nr:7SK snRNA methylphosphate capping enzyme-like [Panonychus citri]
MPKIRAKDGNFQYGNYNRYYGYRNQNVTIDPRISCFESCWFKDQHVLDIGCNVGHVTLTIARDFNPCKIIGIDIDENLIEAAKRNIKNYVKSDPKVRDSLRKRLDINVISKHNCGQSIEPINVQLNGEENGKCDEIDAKGEEKNFPNGMDHLNGEAIKLNDHSKSPIESNLTTVSTESTEFAVSSSSQSLPINSSTQSDPSTKVNLISQSSFDDESPTSVKRIKLDNSKPVDFPRNVKFFCENYFLDCDDLLNGEKPEFDCILCLSVTKWIHLNFGDEGLKRVFKRMYRQLRSGGRLILEPQPWSSYKKKKLTSEITLKNYLSIKFKPDDFNEYLLSSEVGFSSSELLKTPIHESKGFQRPIFLFLKSKESS